MKVSTATVSRAFSGKGRIKPETRTRILSKAAELGYRPHGNMNYQNIPSENPSIVFFYSVPEDIETDYLFSEMIPGLTRAVYDSGYHLENHMIMEDCEHLPEHCKNIFFSNNISGIITISGTKFYKELLRMAEKWKKPFLVIGSCEDPSVNTVSFQVESGARVAGGYFRRNGYKHPAFIGGITDIPKRKGFIDGIEISQSRILWEEGGSNFNDGYLSFKSVINKGKIDCAFCANDILAIGFIRAALEEGYRVPEDIAVIGCDGSKVGKYYSPALSTINLPKYEIGDIAVKELMNLIRNKCQTVKKSLECELIIRESA